MKTMNPTTNRLTQWLADSAKGNSLVLTPQGDLHVDAKHHKITEDYLLYTGNTLHMKHANIYSRIGDALYEDFTIDLYRGDLVIHQVENCGCLALHQSPVVKENETFLAYFKWDGTTFLIIADHMISRNLHIAAMESNTEEDAFMLTIFLRMLARHDAGLANNVATRLGTTLNQSPVVTGGVADEGI